MQKYNNQLVIRGEFYLDLEFSEHWDDELREMNKGKKGAQFQFPDSFIKWMAAWHQLVDYRGLEGIGRMLAKYKEFVESDGTGLKTSNAGEYRQFRYIDTNAKRKKYLAVIITADVYEMPL
ncbi:MAG: hypothetical protein QW478_11215 [Candidatus Micrarchaeaceae archaeon]